MNALSGADGAERLPEVSSLRVAVPPAVARWNQHPRVSMIVASGAGTLFLTRRLSNVSMLVLTGRDVDGAAPDPQRPLVAAAFIERAPSRER